MADSALCPGNGGSTRFKYDAHLGVFSTVLRLRRSVVPLVFERSSFWMFLIFHLVVKGSHNFGVIEVPQSGNLLSPDWQEIKIVSAMTTFFIVFYSSHCFSRYQYLYKDVREMFGLMYDFIIQLRIEINPGKHNHARLATRYFLAAWLMFYYELDEEISEAEWSELQRLHLLTPDEQLFLQSGTRRAHWRHSLPGERSSSPRPSLHGEVDVTDRIALNSILLLLWSADVVCKTVSGNTQKDSIGTLLKCRGLQQKITDVMDLPVPYAYFHLLSVMIVVNVLLWGFAMGICTHILSSVTYFFASMIFMGMMELASQFSNPFGTDEVDFPVSEWFADLLQSAALIIESPHPGVTDSWKSILAEEEALPRALQEVNFVVNT